MKAFWVRWRLVTDLALWATLLAVTMVILLRNDDIPDWMWVVAVAAQVANIVGTRRAVSEYKVIGRWEERADFLGAAQEAQQRGMSNGEFLAAYVERCIAELPECYQARFAS